MPLEHAPAHLRLAFHDAGTFDERTGTGGAHGTVHLPEELQPEPKELRTSDSARLREPGLRRSCDQYAEEESRVEAHCPSTCHRLTWPGNGDRPAQTKPRKNARAGTESARQRMLGRARNM